MHAQRLQPRLAPDRLIEVVQDVCGVNAQLYSAMQLSLRARVAGLTASALEAARVEQRGLVRTWCMRSTMHLLAGPDLDWMLSTLDPAHLRAAWQWMERRAGLDRPAAEAVLEAACAILRERGPLSRRELMRLVSAQVGFDAAPAAAGTVLLGGLLGRICFGPDQGAGPTYAALEPWLGHPVDGSQEPDLAQLARRYLHGYGPASPADLAAWWGMGLSPARKAFRLIEGELVRLEVDGQPLWQLSNQMDQPDDPLDSPCVRLIPAFDTYLLGYRDRDFAVPKPLQSQVFHGGQIAPVILADGLAVGTWRYEQRGGKFMITVAPFETFPPQMRERIAGEAEDIGRFYALKACLSFQAG